MILFQGSVKRVPSLTTRDLVKMLQDCPGFAGVRVRRVRHVLHLDMRRLCAAVRMRYASTLAGLSDAELEAGADALWREHGGADHIDWPICKDLVVASKAQEGTQHEY